MLHNQLRKIVTSLGSELVILTKSHQKVIQSWNQQIVKELCNSGNTLFRTEEIGHTCGIVDRTYPPKC